MCTKVASYHYFKACRIYINLVKVFSTIFVGVTTHDRHVYMYTPHVTGGNWYLVHIRYVVLRDLDPDPCAIR
jgi:hypothetical protein